MQNANKNPPWARAPTGNMDMSQGIQAGMGGGGMMQYGAAGVYPQAMMQNTGANMMGMQGGVAMGQMGGGGMYPGNVVAYPTPRAMNSGAYPAQPQPTAAEQRVFTGTITKTHNDFGFVDHDVFYQTSVCAKGILPKVNDRVLVEATYNATMPFKWNATRVQVLNSKTGPIGGAGGGGVGSGYNAVPPPGGDAGRGDRFRKPGNNARRDDRPRRSPVKRTRSRSKSPQRSKRRDSPPRKRSPRRSPRRSPPPPTPKYVVRVPRIPLDISDVDVTSMTQRYSNLYIPSDFFASSVRWGEAFPPQYPFSLHHPCNYHVMPKEVPNPVQNDAVLEPPDADYRFSAKVMLISLPTLESLYQKCGLTKSDSKGRDSKATLHPTRLIKFLVGQKGKGGDSFAIGGPWSPSLDGPNPESDPSVLVKTAIRTTKALTGVDLTPCTSWFRMVEFYYWRESSGDQKARLETVVLFLPDVWSAMPQRPDWTVLQDTYKKALEGALNPNAATEKIADDSKIEESLNDSAMSDDVTVSEDSENKPKKEPTHYSKLDMKTIKVDQLRDELDARSVSSRGLRAQLLARLSKLLKSEEEKEKKEKEEEEQAMELEKEKEKEEEEEEKKKKMEEKLEVEAMSEKDLKALEEAEKKKKEEEERKKKAEEKAAAQLRSKYALPSVPHLIVHASSTARGGKFSCSLATLSLLLDYRVTDNKEHSFEIFVFAELFNEMLQRDFGFYIYKTLYTVPERVEEEKEHKDDKKKDKRESDKKDSDKKESDKKDSDKKESDKKDSDSKDSDKKGVDKKETLKEESPKEAETAKEEKMDVDEKKEEGSKVEEGVKVEEQKEAKDDVKEKKDDGKDKKKSGRESVESERRDRGGSPAPAKKHGKGVELPTDPYLLLALVYFDTARCGYIVRRDLQSLFMALGLQLSRSQVKALVDKVCVKENFCYKRLMEQIKDLANGSAEALQDLPLDSTVSATNVVSPVVAELEATIAAGNRNLLPVFDDGTRGKGDSAGSGETKEVGSNGMVLYKKRLVDVGATLTALSRSEQAKAQLEKAVMEARGVARSLRTASVNHLSTVKSLQANLAEANDKLSATRSRLSAVTASSKIFHSTLQVIQSKVEAVVNINFEADVNEDVEIVNGPTKVESNDVEVSEDKESSLQAEGEDLGEKEMVLSND